MLLLAVTVALGAARVPEGNKLRLAQVVGALGIVASDLIMPLGPARMAFAAAAIALAMWHLVPSTPRLALPLAALALLASADLRGFTLVGLPLLLLVSTAATPRPTRWRAALLGALGLGQILRTLL